MPKKKVFAKNKQKSNISWIIRLRIEQKDILGLFR